MPEGEGTLDTEKDTFFFKTRTVRVPTWKVVVLLVAILGALPFACWPLIRGCITGYVWDVSTPKPGSTVVIENWDGQLDFFEEGRKVFDAIRGTTLCSIIYEDSYANPRKRQTYLNNAWGAGIDTSKLKLIAVLKEDPKTLHTARAVVDTALDHHWTEITLLTFDLHTARSGKCYRTYATPAGIDVQVGGLPYDGVDHTNWFETSSGMAGGFSEFVKRVYYDIFVL